MKANPLGFLVKLSMGKWISEMGPAGGKAWCSHMALHSSDWQLPPTVRDEGSSSGCVLSHQPGPGVHRDKAQTPQVHVWQLTGSDR